MKRKNHSPEQIVKKLREAEHIQSKMDVSERRACKVITQPRMTQRYNPTFAVGG